MESNRTNQAEDVARAEADVQESRAELGRSLRQVGKTSESLLRQAKAELTPGLLIGAAVVGAVAVAGVTIALTRRGRQRSWLAPQSSTFGVVAKAVAIWALRIGARHAAQAVVARLEQPQSDASAAPAV